MLSEEQHKKLAAFAATHDRMANKPFASGFKGTTVQVTVQCHTAVLFMGMTPLDAEALTDEEFEQLCALTGQTPYDLEVSGVLDIKHSSTFVNRRDALEDEY